MARGPSGEPSDPRRYRLLRCSPCGSAGDGGRTPGPEARLRHAGEPPRPAGALRAVQRLIDRQPACLLRGAGPRVLDAGAGRGRLVPSLRAAGFEASGIDPSGRRAGLERASIEEHGTRTSSRRGPLSWSTWALRRLEACDFRRAAALRGGGSPGSGRLHLEARPRAPSPAGRTARCARSCFRALGRSHGLEHNPPPIALALEVRGGVRQRAPAPPPPPLRNRCGRRSSVVIAMRWGCMAGV